MELLHEDLPMEGERTDDWNIIFELEGYVYNLGENDGPPHWFSRKTIEDYRNNTGEWEKPDGWINENVDTLSKLKFLS